MAKAIGSDNVNFLAPQNFQFVLRRIPNSVYFCQAVDLPDISLGEVVHETPFVKIPQPSDKIVFGQFSVRFRIDEDMKNYHEIYNWMIELGFPDSFEQFRNGVDAGKQELGEIKNLKSDGTLLILTSKNNVNVRIDFEDMYPTSLSPLTFDVQQTDFDYLEATAVFALRKYKLNVT